jgi:hypothetical protein
MILLYISGIVIGFIVIVHVISDVFSPKPKSANLDEGPSFFFITGPAKRPQLPPKLEPYVHELHGIYRRRNTFDYAARAETRAIGERINTDHGYEAMVTVCDTLRFVISGPAARELEYVWDHIGEWRN